MPDYGVYFIDIGVPRPMEGHFEAPDGAAPVVVIDSVIGEIKGVVFVTDIVSAIGYYSPVGAVYDAVQNMLEAGSVVSLTDAGEREASEVTRLVESVRGVVEIFDDRSPDSPAWRDVQENAVSLPGFPTTPVGNRKYRCGNGHEVSLSVGNDGAQCPECPLKLHQVP